LQKATLSELIYMADNMAFLPYQVQDEPLYIIHQIDIIVSVSGSNILQSYKEEGSLFLCQNEVIIASHPNSLVESCGVGPASVGLCDLSTICV
jgi:cohesin loading factor subunit SCC2